MNAYQAIGALTFLAAAFSYINYRFLRIPTTIGLILLSLGFSLFFLVLRGLGLPTADLAFRLVGNLDFSGVLLHGILGMLLFAGALHVNLDEMWEQKAPIITLATVGVVISTLCIGSLLFLASSATGFDLPFITCLLFGALISPTDPISVLAILKKANAPKSLEVKIAGESLINDGVGVVVFLAVLHAATGEAEPEALHLGVLFLTEVAGGIAFGLLTGYIAFLMLRSVDRYQVEVLITLALVLGGYPLAEKLHISAPIAMVAAGLLIGNHGRRLAMSKNTVEHLDTFWEMIDEILNSVLFVAIGLEVLVVNVSAPFLLLGAMSIPVALFSRFLAVSIPILIMSRFRKFSKNAISVLTWGGLRGGISVALALSIPASAGRESILTMTYAVVTFSILVQGMTIRKVMNR